LGSYDPADIVLLLSELPDTSLELPTDVRAALLAAGGHYAETLPIEYEPTFRYERLFEQLLASRAERVAVLVRVLAERILRVEPAPVLLSLARAGTPIGVLLRRALARAGVDAPHYTISIVRDRGIDERALRFVLQRHRPGQIVFVDGWTGKGMIAAELTAALDTFARRHGTAILPRLAVLADPARVTDLCATHADELIPSACLNSTVSGLISRTVLRSEMRGHPVFHGVRVYREFAARDRSRHFVDTVSACFATASGEQVAAAHAVPRAPLTGCGLREAERVRRELGLSSVHLVKPGIGETTRVLLRRTPRAVLIDSRRRAELAHVLLLAEERSVRVVERRSEVFACFGVIDG
jgi:hypothetical protein